jgi:gamma-glutamyltranspeptidase/glutathione hydrolase
VAWKTLFDSAIAVASDGFAVGVRTSLWWRRAAQEIALDPELRGRLHGFNQTFLRDAEAPMAGQGMRNAGLARLFEVVAAEGPAGFYTGVVAEEIARTVRTAGGFLSLADLAAMRADWITPLHADYRSHRVHVLPPNGQGLSVLQMLNMLQEIPESKCGPAHPVWWHLFLEAKKLAFADRARYFADPAFAEIPVAELLAPDYAAQRAALIDLRRARADQTPGRVRVPGGDTTYLTVADDRGQMVSLIQSLFVPFGSALVLPTFGFALQSRGTGFALNTGHPNVYAPEKRPFHTIMPGFVTRADQPYLCFGAIGGDMQPQAQVQILARMLDGGCDVERAGALPRIRHVGGQSPNGLQDSPLGIACYEPELSESVVADLVRRGHALQRGTDPIGGFVGGYQGIMRDPVTGTYWGSSDHRLDGCALGL